MEDTIVSYKTAKLAKEKGFNIPTIDLWYSSGKEVELHQGVTSHQRYINCSEKFSGANVNDYEQSDITIKNLLQFPDMYPAKNNLYLAPTQSLLQKFIRETRGVHIEIHRNTSGYYWSMCRADGGTDLGWSDISGPNDSGVWDSFEDTLENALQVQLSYDLPNDTTIIKHWGNYVEFALKSK